MKQITKTTTFVLVTALAFTTVHAPSAEAAKKVTLSKKKITLTVGKRAKLKLKNCKKKVKWTSSKKKVATVSKKGVVTAKSQGSAKITAKAGKKKYTCKVKVIAKNSDSTNTSAPSTTQTPIALTTPPPMTNSSATASPAPVVSDSVINNFTTLKNYILTNGTTNSSGNKFIRYYDSDNTPFDIEYSSESKTFYFSFPFDYTGSDYTVDSAFVLGIKEASLGSATSAYKFSYSNGLWGLYTCTTNTANITDHNTLTWTKLEGTYPTEGNHLANNLSNSALNLGCYGWSYLLRDSVNMTLNDLGFSVS
nr:Ig-like domain-containing protein [Eubacterium sp.]